MAIPTYSTGQVIDAPDVNNWFVPHIAYKTSAQGVTSSTTLVNDSALAVAVAANSVYIVQGCVYFDATATANYKFGWTAPASSTFLWNFDCPAIANNGFQNTLATVLTLTGQGAGTIASMQIFGLLTTSTSAGNLQYQFAQGTSNGTASNTDAGSWLLLTKAG